MIIGLKFEIRSNRAGGLNSQYVATFSGQYFLLFSPLVVQLQIAGVINKKG